MVDIILTLLTLATVVYFSYRLTCRMNRRKRETFELHERLKRLEEYITHDSSYHYTFIRPVAKTKEEPKKEETK